MKRLFFYFGMLCVSVTAFAEIPRLIATTETHSAAASDFVLSYDLVASNVVDETGRVWYGGHFTEMPEVTIGMSDDESLVKSIKVSVMRCNGIVRTNYTYMLLEDAVEKGNEDVDIKVVSPGTHVEYDVSVPGRYCLGFCLLDAEERILDKGSIYFDSLYDDGAWIECGEAELSSGILDGDNVMWHHFHSNGNGFMETPGDVTWWHCPVQYPHYHGETWTANLEYHSVHKMYRIVNPFSQYDSFQNFVPGADELLWALYDNIAYEPEAFLFDRENPAWFLLNAQYEHDAYCEPMRTGMAAFHTYENYCYYAHRYNEHIGYVIYDVCPTQSIKGGGTYIDMPLNDELGASLIVKIPDWVVVEGMHRDSVDEGVCCSIDGTKAVNPQKGLLIVKRNGKFIKEVIK